MWLFLTSPNLSDKYTMVIINSFLLIIIQYPIKYEIIRVSVWHFFLYSHRVNISPTEAKTDIMWMCVKKKKKIPPGWLLYLMTNNVSSCFIFFFLLHYCVISHLGLHWSWLSIRQISTGMWATCKVKAAASDSCGKHMASCQLNSSDRSQSAVDTHGRCRRCFRSTTDLLHG